MILNTHLKNLGIRLKDKSKMHLGINIKRRFDALYPNVEIRKVCIKINDEKVFVIDYPSEFLKEPGTIKIIKKFINRGKAIALKYKSSKTFKK